MSLGGPEPYSHIYVAREEQPLAAKLVLVWLIFVSLLLLCNVQPQGYLAMVFEYDTWVTFFLTTSPVSAYASGQRK